MATNLAPTFKIGTGKAVTTDFGSSNLQVGTGLAIQPDGKIIIVGHVSTNSSDFAVARYNPDGSLDSSFDVDGKLFIDLGGTDVALNVAVQQDGKIIIAGSSYAGSNLNLVRINANGSIDTTFDVDGKLAAPHNINSVTLQSDGKILIVDNDTFNDNFYSITRYNTNGSVDTSFGNNGTALDRFYYQGNLAKDVVVQADGKILIAGTANNDFFALLRYNSDGTLDTTFGNIGFITTDFSTSNAANFNTGKDGGESITLQANGKILIAGYSSSNNGTYKFAIARYNSDGSLDVSFDGDGKVTTYLNFTNGAKSITVQDDGKILVAGSMGVIGDGANFAIIRLNANGSLDTTFDGDGIVTTSFGQYNDQAQNVTVLANGKILVTGVSTTDSVNYSFALAQYNSDGSLDTHFNATIDTLNNSPSYVENANPLVLDSTVQIYDAELAALNSGNGNFSGASVTLARQGGANVQDVFSSSGNLSFSGGNVILSGVTIGSLTNTNGTLSVTFNSNATQARVNEALSAIAYSNSSDARPPSVQINWSFNDGNIGAQGTGGAQTTVGSTTVNITAVNDAPTFSVVTGNGTGLISTSISSTADNPYSIALQQDGSILIAGTSNADFAVTRFNADGILDKSFDVDGILTTPVSASLGDAATAIAIQADEKILTAGYSVVNQKWDFSLVRYNCNGLV